MLFLIAPVCKNKQQEGAGHVAFPVNPHSFLQDQVLGHSGTRKTWAKEYLAKHCEERSRCYSLLRFER